MSEFPEVKDHLVANPDKYTMTTNPDGTVTLRPTWVDNPSEVLQEGTPVDAAFLSKIPEAIDAIDTKVTSQLADKASKTYVDQLTQSIASGSPKGTYATVSALTTAFPSGNTNIYVVSADGKWYYWNGTAWTAGGIYQATAIGDGAVSRPKLASTLSSELNIAVENNLGSVFEYRDKNYFYSTLDITFYNTVYGAIRDLTLTGFDTSRQHRLRLIARNHATFKYRFIIAQRANVGDAWTDVFDSGSGFTVTENASGLTTVTHTINGKTVTMKIDYSQIPNGSSNSDGLLGANDGRYIISPKAFYENKVEKVKADVAALQNDLNNLDGAGGLYVTKSGTSFKAKFRYGSTQNMVIEWDQLGINQLIHPKKMYKETAALFTSDFATPVLWYTLSTDWIAPYSGITALTGTTTTFAGTVGGTHGTVGAGGFPTARNVSANLYVNGKEVQDGEIVNTDKAVLIVKNYISASNKINVDTGAKADSLEELVTYVITPNNIEVSVHLTALEDLRINGYAGLQMTTNMFTGQAYFNDSANKYSADGILHNSLSLPFDGDRMVYADAGNVVTTYTNRNTGLGDLSAKGSAAIHFLSAFNKLYSHLITNPVTVLANKSVYYSGGYTFDVPMTCPGAEKAYFIKYNGVKEYCADFLAAATDTYFVVGVEHAGKEIEIVEKSDSITCDNLISAKGLKITATGFGTLKFRIKPA